MASTIRSGVGRLKFALGANLATATGRIVETFVGNVISPATAPPAGSAIDTGVSTAQTSTTTVGTAAQPIITTDVSVLDVSLHATAFVGTLPTALPSGVITLATINIARVEPDNLTLANQTVHTIASIPVVAVLDTTGTPVMPADVFTSVGQGQRYNVDFGAGVIVTIVLASWVTSLTRSWSLQGKS